MKKTVTLKLRIENLTNSQAVALINMFQEMERFGKIGHSGYIGFYADGDGDFRPKIYENSKFSKKNLEEYAEKTKVYKKQVKTKDPKARFPWSDELTLFDFDGLVRELDG